MRLLTAVGFVLTAAWLSIVGIVVLYNLSTVSQMTLNAWGDFLAGVSAPLALLWLVIGYFQQGEELRINTKALEAQQKELQHQVKETAHLARSSERQAKATELQLQITKSEQESKECQKIRDAQPDFVSEGGGTSGLQSTTKIRNHGGPITDIVIEYTGPHHLEFNPTKRFDTKELGQLNVNQEGQSVTEPICFRITYTDQFGGRRTIACELESHSIHFQPSFGT